MTDHLDPTGISDADVLAVSAYVDGDLAPADRARIESDARLSALATAIAAARSSLLSPPPVTAAQRDAAVSAALSAAQAGSPAPGRSTTDHDQESAAVAVVRPLRRSARWIGGLAAAAVVAVVGLGVAMSLGGDDDDDSISSASETLAMETMAAAEGSPAAETAGGIEIQGPADEIPAGADDSQTAPADATAGGPPTDGDAAARTDAPDTSVDLQDAHDLAEFASRQLAASPTSVAASTAIAAPMAADGTVCGYEAEHVLGVVLFKGEPAAVVLTDDGGTALAVATATCDELADTPLP